MHTKASLILLTCLKIQLCALDFDLYFNFDQEGKKQESSLKKKSELFLATNQTYNSIFALREQAQLDAKNLEEALKGQGYLDAQVVVLLDTHNQIPSVIFEFHTGNPYKIGSLILNPPFNFENTLQNEQITYLAVEQLETRLLLELRNNGFAHAKLIETKLVITQEGVADIHIDYQTGPLCFFGQLITVGLKKVKPSFIQDKLPWKEGELFNEAKLESLQKNLLDTQLFSQVTIKTLETPLNSIPIEIEVVESKFNTISVGISYQTHFGAGGDLSFENKNLAGKGERLSLETSITQNSLLGKLDYLIPQLGQNNQSLNLKLEATREQLQPSFSDNLYEFSCKFSKSPAEVISYDLGIATRYYLVQHSVMNGHYALMLPYFKWRFDNTYNLLDPKEGIKATLGAFFYQNLNHSKNFFEGTFKSAFYYSAFKNRLTLAQRLYIGSFFAPSLDAIPVPLRFFGGTDEYLRGFKYYTVSPLNGHKPIGGQSCLFFNSELRINVTNPFGIVMFYDSGFVSAKKIAFINSPYYQSVGLGLRYYAFFGPLRVDIGFPLNPRKRLDSKFKILASFGHTF